MTELYHYRMCGLDYIYLENGYTTSPDKDIGVMIVSESGNVAIEHVNDLHKEIGTLIASGKRELEGQDVRFLRGTLHMSQMLLAEMLGVEDEQIEEWEKGESKIPAPVEKGLRYLFLFNAQERGPLTTEILLMRTLTLRDKWVFELVEDVYWRMTRYAGTN